MTYALFILEFLAYILASRLIVRKLTGGWREAAFTLVNIAGYYWFFIHGANGRFGIAFPVYLAIAGLQYITMRLYSEKQNWQAWIAFCTPILMLVMLRYVPISAYAHLRSSLQVSLLKDPTLAIAPFFLGISYLAFRCSHLVLEVRNGIVKKPGFWEYIGFCFFVPTMPVGPINTYSNYRQAFAVAPPEIPMGRSALRILVGFIKYQFLGSLFGRLTYSGLLMDDHYHHWIDLPVAVLFYYLFLYCNFSGFCDMAIGAAGLIGIPVPENFQNPFASRNMREFWNRWHITLSQYMRDVVFAPLSKFLVRWFGPSNANHAIALTILVVFLLIGIWHGVGWNYAAFGLAQALGVATTHYYTIGLKKWLGRDGFKAYNANPWIHAAAVTFTFCYYAATLFLFANTFGEMRDIFAALR